MSRFRSLRTQSPALAIATLALVFSLGGGAGYAASTASSAAKISFHKMTLRNGWTTDGPASDSPSVGVSGEVVYLTGGMHQTSGSSTEFAVLPKADWPTHTLWIGVYSEAATNTAFLEVTTSGAMFIGGTDAQSFASLSGVSFPVGG